MNNGCPVNGKGSLSFPDKEPTNRGGRIRTADLLPPPRQAAEPPEPQENQANPGDTSRRCTTGCTTEAKTDQADPVAAIAALAKLSAADRAGSPPCSPGEPKGRGQGRDDQSTPDSPMPR